MQPKLRFKEFTDEWQEKKLGDFVIQMQSGLSRKLSSTDIGIPILRSNNIQNQIIDISDIAFWYEDDPQGAKTSNYFLEDGDLLVNFINSPAQIGKFAIYENQLARKAIFTTNIMRLKFNNQFLSKFIFYSFCQKKYKNYIDSITKPAVNQASFTTIDFKNFRVYIPDLNEQQKIADFLTTVDNRIQLLEKKKKDYEIYKKGVMWAIFSQKIRFKKSDGSNYPDWEEKKMGDVADIRDGTHESPKYVAKGYPLVTSKNLMKSGDLDLQNVGYISDNDFNNIKKRSGVNIGDILFGMIGTIGNPVRLTSDNFAIKNVALIKENGQLGNTFLIQYLYSPYILKQFHIDNAGGTQKFIALGVIRNLKIRVPSSPEQEKIAEFLTSLDDKIKLINKELEQAKLFKKFLLQQMFV